MPNPLGARLNVPVQLHDIEFSVVERAVDTPVVQRAIHSDALLGLEEVHTIGYADLVANLVPILPEFRSLQLIADAITESYDSFGSNEMSEVEAVSDAPPMARFAASAMPGYLLVNFTGIDMTAHSGADLLVMVGDCPA